MFKFSDEEIQKLVAAIFSGEITEYDLPEYLYFSLADALKDGLYKGFGIDFNTLTEQINKGVSEFTTSDLELLTELRENTYFFSAAKTFQQTKEMSDLLTGKEALTTFPEFKAAALEIFGTYNEDWLKTEYGDAIAKAQMAVKWNDIIESKDILPYVKFSVVEDANTTDICQPLDGIVVKIDDPMLDIYYPPNHWNCRTTIEQQEDDVTLSSKEDVDKATAHADEEMTDTFRMNSGKDKVIFSENHPYFDVDKKDRAFAEKNFNLPIPDSD